MSNKYAGTQTEKNLERHLQASLRRGKNIHILPPRQKKRI